MTEQQPLILVILALTVGMFLWGRWRHDMVAAGALLACVLTGLIEPADAFAGFGHTAVVTVACVLILSHTLQTSGAVDVLTRVVLPANAGPTLSIAALIALAALLSAFMNNVGALALLMPVAIQLAGRLNLPPGKVLMPLAFGSILGGTTTLIGTPPNLIISGFRQSAGMDGFSMFAFTPVGVVVTVAGLAFIALVGWRLVPARKQSGIEGFETGAYVTEARIPADSKLHGLTLRQIDDQLGDLDAQVVGLVRNEVRLTAPQSSRRVYANDILVIECEAETLSKALSTLDLTLEEAQTDAPKTENDNATAHKNHAAERESPAAPAQDGKAGNDTTGVADADADDAGSRVGADEYVLMEVAVLPSSTLLGRSATDLMLRTRYGINLLAVSRQGTRFGARLRNVTLRAGDLLLLQGPPDSLSAFASSMGCVPLAERELRIPDKRNVVLSSLIMVLSVGAAASGLMPSAIAFTCGVLASMALRTIALRSVYEAVDWPVIILLACLLPVAGAMQSTGAAGWVAGLLLDYLAQGDPVVGLIVILITTMVLTDLMNNAATAAVLAPIALGAANQLGVNPDTYLMAVAIGASCAFLTPIGHQNNTLILGPGGFRFGDYWRMGLPVDLLVIATAIPMLLMVWPLDSN
ncbi:MAG: SLC13 family permease [Burkholderiaceae bacterium]